MRIALICLLSTFVRYIIQCYVTNLHTTSFCLKHWILTLPGSGLQMAGTLGGERWVPVVRSARAPSDNSDCLGFLCKRFQRRGCFTSHAIALNSLKTSSHPLLTNPWCNVTRHDEGRTLSDSPCIEEPMTSYQDAAYPVKSLSDSIP